MNVPITIQILVIALFWDQPSVVGRIGLFMWPTWTMLALCGMIWLVALIFFIKDSFFNTGDGVTGNSRMFCSS